MSELSVQKEQLWSKLERECAECTACELCRSRQNVVFGFGDKKARIMFIGEAPGESEDLSGLPFVGAAGRLLDDMLLIMGFSREQVYIANILKCRPPHNRDPLPEEQCRCFGYLERQIELVNPRMIVCLGRIAAARIIHENFKITVEHGNFVKRGERTLTAIYHPSALLRDLSKRPETFDDLKKIREFMQTPDVSEVWGTPLAD